MRVPRLRLALLAAVALALPAGRPPAQEMDHGHHGHGMPEAPPLPPRGDELTSLRVCADPDNLPFSDKDGRGFENRIAELVAKDLGLPLSYYWWPTQRGLVRRTLGEDRCDVLSGIPHDFDPVLTTRAYYRSTYVIVTRKDLAIRSLDDPALKRLRIGAHFDTPPWVALGERGLMDQVRGYPLMFDYRDPDGSRRPSRLLQDLKDGALDVAFVWGPMAGWFAKSEARSLSIVPVRDGGRVPMAFAISMGVRKSDKALRARLDDALARHEEDIRRILVEYGVPLVAEEHGSR